MKRNCLLLFVLALSLTGFAKNIKTVVVTTVPQMECSSCERTIKNNIRFEKGVKSIVTDIEKQTVTIEYDADKTTEQRLAESFGKFGYRARILDGKDFRHDGDYCTDGGQHCRPRSSCCGY